MVTNNFWLVTLCVLLIVSANICLSIPLRIALGANAVVILIDVIKRARRLYDEQHNEKNENIHRG